MTTTARQRSVTTISPNFDIDTGKILIAGKNGVSDSANVQKDWVNFGPRVGFASSFPHDTVLRGGFGISYIPILGSTARFG